jgi:hypothetical protein
MEDASMRAMQIIEWGKPTGHAERAVVCTGLGRNQSGRFTQLEPVIRRTFDIPWMARLSGRLFLGHSDRGPTAAG